MTSTTLTGRAEKVSALFANGSLSRQDSVEKRFFERGGKRVLGISGVPVFRSGTFRDSIGFQHSYDEFHIDGFVRNFDHLKAQGVFQDVPIRKGHPSFGQNPMDGVIGYVTSLRTEKRESPVDGREQSYLLADFEILDSEAQEKIDSGLYRNRSAEVGTYVDNNEAEYSPVFMGVAYVDIPAVEGLNGFSKNLPADSSIMMEEEMSSTTVTPPPAPGQHDKAPAPAATFSIGGTETSDYAAVQSYIGSIENRLGEFEKADKARRVAAREQFVTSLVEANKITAPQKDATMEFAKSLSEEQFSAWSTMQEAAPANSILGTYGHQEAGSGAPEEPVDTEVDKDREVVKGLAFSGLPTEKVKASAAFQRVIEKDPTFIIPQRTALGQ